MRVHILGICGTFMGGLALIARQLGYQVSGSDLNVYPPMSDVLKNAGIPVQEGYDPGHLKPAPDLVIIGNSLGRGNAAVEYILNKGIAYISGAQWLAEKILHSRQVLAVAGTHGKTTTGSLLTWILTQAGLKPGYLIGGAPNNFEQTARLGEAPLFVVEADEYDTAFFDKRSKFIHYRPRTLIINNLEFDHADIFTDLEAIKKQFQYLLRTVPSSGTVIYPDADVEVADVLSRGFWSAKMTIGAPNGIWQAHHQNADGSHFELWHRDQKLGIVEWCMVGQHNVHNALAAAAAAHEAGVTSDKIIQGLQTFKGVKRRLEVRGHVNGVTVYDDFAHHPTAIAATISALRAKVGTDQRIFAVLEFGSNTMRQGVHRQQMAPALKMADRVTLLRPDLWDAVSLVRELGSKASLHDDVSDIIRVLASELRAQDHVLIMSNKGFDGIHQRLLKRLKGVTLEGAVGGGARL